MALNKASFKQTASRLIGKAKAGDLTASCVFSTKGAYNPITGAYGAGDSETILCVRESYSANSVDNQNILSGDFRLLALVDDFVAIVPSPDSIDLTVDGVSCRIVTVESDAADAVYTVQVRRL